MDRSNRLLLVTVFLLLAAPLDAAAQRVVPSASAGIHTGRHFLGVELGYRPFQVVAFVLRGEGMILAAERAGFVGVRVDVLSSPGVWLYVTPMAGLHYCYTANLGGSATSCPPADRYRFIAAGLGGVEFRMGDRSPWSLALESGAWYAELDTYSQWALSVIVRRVLFIEAR